jgi:hypothetical protein
MKAFIFTSLLLKSTKTDTPAGSSATHKKPVFKPVSVKEDGKKLKCIFSLAHSIIKIPV